MRKKFKLIIIFFMIISGIVGCTQENEEKEKEKSQLNVYIDVENAYSNEIINFIIKEFESSNENIDLNIVGGLKNDNFKLEQESNMENVDIFLTSRNNMIELNKRGLISNVNDMYDEKKINDNYYDIMSSYGRIREDYYGISIIPYTVELLFNKSVLRESNINNPRNVEEWLTIMKMVKDKGNKIPIVISENLDLHNIIASLSFNNNVNSEDLVEIYNSGTDQYLKLEEMQSSFDSIHEFVNNGYINESTFDLGNENSIDEFLRGEIPLLVCSSYYHNKFNESQIGIIEKYISEDGLTKYNIPVFVDVLANISITNKSKMETDEFIKFILSEETQKKFAQTGYITGNKKANENFTGFNKIIVEHLYNSTNNSIPFVYNIPSKLSQSIAKSTHEILKGNYTGNEWQEIVKSFLF